MASSVVPAGSMASRFPLSNQGSEVCWKGMCHHVSQAPVPPIFVGIKICFSSSSVEKKLRSDMGAGMGSGRIIRLQSFLGLSPFSMLLVYILIERKKKQKQEEIRISICRVKLK